MAPHGGGCRTRRRRRVDPPHHLRGDVGARGRHRRDQPRAGFPDEDGPAEVLEAAREAIAHGVNQYPPGRGIPDLLVGRSRSTSERFYGLELDPGPQRPRDRGRHRGARGGAARARRRTRTTRSSSSSRTTTPTPRRGALAGRAAGHRAAALAGLPARPRGAPRRASRDRTRVDPGERSAQPDRRGVQPPRCATRSCASPSATTPSSSPTRCYEHLVFDGAARPDRHAAGRAGAHAHDLVGRQDVLDDGLEDRLDHRGPRRPRGRPCSRSSSS